MELLPLVHATVGSLVVISNGLAALWLLLLDGWRHAISPWARFGLYTARSLLVLQIVLGLTLVAQGVAGATLHYFFALAAAAAIWLAFVQARRTLERPLRVLAAGCAAACLLALGAYLLGGR